MHLIENSLRVEGETVIVTNESALRANIDKLAQVSALGEREEAAKARYLIRAAALALGMFPPPSTIYTWLADEGYFPPPGRRPPSTSARCLSIAPVPLFAPPAKWMRLR